MYALLQNIITLIRIIARVLAYPAEFKNTDIFKYLFSKNLKSINN